MMDVLAGNGRLSGLRPGLRLFPLLDVHMVDVLGDKIPA